MTMVPDVQRALTAPIRELPTEHAKRYQAKLEGYRADYEPRGTLENDLVAEMAHLVLQLEQTRAVAAALQRKPKTASKRLELGLLERAIVAQAKEIHRLELFEQARDDFYHRRGNQPFSRKPWHPDPRLTGELPP